MDYVSLKDICKELYKCKYKTDTYNTKIFKNYYIKSSRHFSAILEDLNISEYTSIIQPENKGPYEIPKEDIGFVSWILNIYESEKYRRIIEFTDDNKAIWDKWRVIDGFSSLFSHVTNGNSTVLYKINNILYNSTHFPESKIAGLLNNCAFASVDQINSHISEALNEGSLPERYISAFLKSYESFVREQQLEWIKIFKEMTNCLNANKIGQQAPDELIKWVRSSVEDDYMRNVIQSQSSQADWIINKGIILDHLYHNMQSNDNCKQIDAFIDAINAKTRVLPIKACVRNEVKASFDRQMVPSKGGYLYILDDEEAIPIVVDKYGNMEIKVKNSWGYSTAEKIITGLLYTLVDNFIQCEKASKSLLQDFPTKAEKVMNFHNFSVFLKPIWDSDEFLFGITTQKPCFAHTAMTEKYKPYTITDLNYIKNELVKITAKIFPAAIKDIINITDGVEPYIENNLHLALALDQEGHKCYFLMLTSLYYCLSPDIYYDCYGLVCGLNESDQSVLIFIDSVDKHDYTKL